MEIITRVMSDLQNLTLVEFIGHQLLPLIVAIGVYTVIIKGVYKRYISFDWERYLPYLMIGAGTSGALFILNSLSKGADMRQVYTLLSFIIALIVLVAIVYTLIYRNKTMGEGGKSLYICLLILAGLWMALQFSSIFFNQFPLYNIVLGFVNVKLGELMVWWNTVNPFPHMQLFQQLAGYIPDYINAFITVGLWAAVGSALAVRYRTSIWWAEKVLLSVVVYSPILATKYSVSETPFADYLIRQWGLGYIKNTLTDTQRNSAKNDSKAVGADLEQNDTLREQMKTLRHTHMKVITRRGVRKATVRFKLPADQKFKEEVVRRLSPLGRALIFNSIVFPDKPTIDGQWLVFKSTVPYRAGEKAVSSLSELFVPFWRIAKDEDGNKDPDESVLGNLKQTLKMIQDYLTILTPTGLKNYLEGNLSAMMSIDTSIIDAKYPIDKKSHNIDYSIFPNNSEEIQAKKNKAVSVAKQRKPQIDSFMTSLFGRNGYIDNGIAVSGSTAIYNYSFNQVVNFTEREIHKLQVALHTRESIDFRYTGGELSLLVPNGIGLKSPEDIIIPADIVEMLESMPTNPKEFVAGISGVKADGSPALVQLGSSNPHMFLFGKTGSGKTVTIWDIVISMMNNRTPDELKFAFIDGKGNSFTLLEDNPYLMAKPASFSADPDYVRSLLLRIRKEVVDRINLFDKVGAEKITDYNANHPDNKIPYLVVVFDEFSAVTDKDEDLKGKDRKFSVIPAVEYIAKMARSVGIIMVLANQTARSEKIPGAIKANITAYISLMVAQPIEARIALPEAQENPYFLNNQGDHYSEFNGPLNIERAQSAYIKEDVLKAVNQQLIRDFGKANYELGDVDDIKAEFVNGDLQDEPKRATAKHAPTKIKRE